MFNGSQGNETELCNYLWTHRLACNKLEARQVQFSKVTHNHKYFILEQEK